MKKYRICLFLFLGVSLVCFLIGFFVQRSRENSGAMGNIETAIESEAAPETVTEDQMASNKDHVQAVTEGGETYYLVAEDGVLLVFLKDRKTICLYTSCASDGFSTGRAEQNLREGIWFSSMAEVFNYLESYTS